MKKRYTTTLIGAAATVSMLAACGQRSELIDCDGGEVELRGNERICLTDEEVQPGPEPEQPSESEPETQIDPEPEVDEPELMRPDPVPEPKPEPQPDPVLEPTPPEMPSQPEEVGYATDDRGYPVPRHAGSFVEVVHAGERACLIDEFADLYCFDVRFGDDVGIERPSRIEPVRSDVKEVALGRDMMCVLDGEGHFGHCLDWYGDWHEYVFASRSRFEQISVSDGGHVCAMDEYSNGSVFCAQLAQGRGLYWDYEPWIEPHYTETFRSFDLAHFSDQTRVQDFAALQSDGIISYKHGSAPDWYVRSVIRSDSEEAFVDLEHDLGIISALTESGQLHYYRMSASGDATELLAPNARFTELYSTQCGLSEEGAVLCWNRDYRLAQEGVHTQTWTLFEAPTSMSMDDDATYCAIMQPGHIECGYAVRR